MKTGTGKGSGFGVRGFAACGLSLALLLAADTLQAADRYWVGAAGANWSAAASWSETSGGSGGAGAPGSGDTAIFNGSGVNNATVDASYGGTVGAVDVQSGYTGTITQNKTLTVEGGFSLAQGATWKYTAGTAATLSIGTDMTVHGTIQCQRTSTSGEGTGRSFTVGGNLVVGSTGVFDADGMGFSGNSGPSKPSGRTGGSHGGRGAFRYAASPGGPAYGSVNNPTSLGSGGGDNAAYSGGGAIILSVTGSSTIDGTLTANGAAGAWGPGAGGTVNLTAASLSGAGSAVIRANAGTTTYQTPAGGGRIALVLTGVDADFSGFAGSVTAFSTENYTAGSAGTIYRKTKGQTYGEVLVHNNDNGIFRDLAADLPAGSYQFDAVNVYSNGNLALPAGATLTIPTATGVLTNSGGGTGYLTLSGGTLTTPSGLTVPSGVALNGGQLAQVALTGPITVASGGLMTHYANGGTEAYKLNLAITGDLTVQSGGSINVQGKGYAQKTGLGTIQPWSQNNGVSHGGQGRGTVVGATHGSVTAPVALGGGGNDRQGGGAVILTVSGTTTIDGSVNANGATGAWCAPAGGSVFITTAHFAGAATGTIQTHGATSSGGYAGAGGGRIAVVLTGSGADFSGYSGTMTAYGSTGTTQPGAAGTVYRQTQAQGTGKGSLTVAAGTATTVTTLISSTVTDASVGDVVIQSNSHLKVDAGQTLAVYGNWSNSGTFSADAGGMVDFAGTTTAILSGNTTFNTLRCSAAGKTLRFTAGHTFTTTGTLTLTGAAGNLVTLESTTPGSQFNFCAQAGCTQADVSYLSVTDSNADGGDAITATDSTDGGNNPNWIFAGGAADIVWDGSESTDWNTPGNWDLDRAPLQGDLSITIPAAPANQPALDKSYLSPGYDGDLIIQSGATLTLAGHGLRIGGDVAVAGTLAATGSQTLSFEGDVDFTGGTFACGQSTLRLAGAAAQTLATGGNTFHILDVANTAAIAVTGSFTTRDLTFPAASATVSFGGGFTTTDLRLIVSGGATLTFGAGQIYTVNNQLLLRGASGNPVVLTGAGAWDLNANGYAVARYVSVDDSDASNSRTIYAVDSVDNGGNVNWNFGNGKVWVGSTTAWTTDANWSPVGQPCNRR